jgi:hypothetical protein
MSNTLYEALKEIIQTGKDWDWGEEFWAVKIATEAIQKWENDLKMRHNEVKEIRQQFNNWYFEKDKIFFPTPDQSFTWLMNKIEALASSGGEQRMKERIEERIKTLERVQSPHHVGKIFAFKEILKWLDESVPPYKEEEISYQDELDILADNSVIKRSNHPYKEEVDKEKRAFRWYFPKQNEFPNDKELVHFDDNSLTMHLGRFYEKDQWGREKMFVTTEGGFFDSTMVDSWIPIFWTDKKETWDKSILESKEEAGEEKK